jgi:hypothetical protein
MKRFLDWQMSLGVILVALSAIVYFGHYLIFRDVHHIFIYMIGDIAFVFVEVLLVTIIIHRILTLREKKSLLNKLNMVIGAFFSEVGTKLIEHFSEFDPEASTIAKELVVRDQWSDKEFNESYRSIACYDCEIEARRGDLEGLRGFLTGKRNFLLRLLENPNLLEHESFTNLLWAVFHLTEELAHRARLKSLPENDYEHLAKDIKRAYLQLISEWLAYMKHLKEDYPYLFSLAMRTNPFDSKANVEVE